MSQELKHPDRTKWMIGKMTSLLTQVSRAVKAKRPGCLISLSPNPLGFSKDNYMADWQFWERLGLLDELVLQVYRDSAASIAGELNKPEVIDIAGQIPVVVGLLTGLRTKPVSTASLESQLIEVRKRNLAGVSCFFYETLLNEALSPVKIPRNPADLARLFP